MADIQAGSRHRVKVVGRHDGTDAGPQSPRPHLEDDTANRLAQCGREPEKADAPAQDAPLEFRLLLENSDRAKTARQSVGDTRGHGSACGQ